MSWEMLCETYSIHVSAGEARQAARHADSSTSVLVSIDNKHLVYGTREVRHAFTEDNCSVWPGAHGDLRMSEPHGASGRIDVVSNPELVKYCTPKGEGKYTAVGEKMP